MAKAPVPEPPGTGVPFSSTTPADVRVHLFPLASVRIPPEVVVISFAIVMNIPETKSDAGGIHGNTPQLWANSKNPLCSSIVEEFLEHAALARNDASVRIFET